MKPPFEWDPYSDQPKVIFDKTYKRRMRARYWPDYLKVLAISVMALPAALIHMMFAPKPQTHQPKPDFSDILGMGVSLDKGSEQFDLIDELGIKHVLIRIPLWETHRLEEYRQFGWEFKRRGRTVFLNILQDREHIEDPSLLKAHISKIFQAFSDISQECQIGNAVNRVKWGFFAPQEYLLFFQRVKAIRDQECPQIKLLGPAVIDFEYQFTARMLFNSHKLWFDQLSALLYVDRMGAPENKQYRIFDANRKIRFLSSLCRLSNKVKQKQIYITEVNWPLAGTAPYAPTSEKECVSEADYCDYMTRYLEIARNTGCVSRIYWHQLIAPGYGLIDNRSLALVKTKAFGQLKKMILTNQVV